MLNLGQGCVGQLEGAEHVDAPVEEETDLSGTSTGGAANGDQAGDGVDGVFNWLGDGDLHLFDGHHAVIDADHNAGEIGVGKDGDRDLVGGIDADDGEGDEEEEDGLADALEPEGLSREVRWFGSRGGHLASPASGLGLPGLRLLGLAASGLAFAGLSSSDLSPVAWPTLTLVPSSRP